MTVMAIQRWISPVVSTYQEYYVLQLTSFCKNGLRAVPKSDRNYPVSEGVAARDAACAL